MTWLDQLLAEHPEITLDSDEDRTRFAVHFTSAYPVDVLTANMLGSLTAVLRVARTDGAIVSTADIHDLASRLARNAVQTTIAVVLGTNANRITKEDIEGARRVESMAAARLRAYHAEERIDDLENQLAAERAENALLRDRARALASFTETHKAT